MNIRCYYAEWKDSSTEEHIDKYSSALKICALYVCYNLIKIVKTYTMDYDLSNTVNGLQYARHRYPLSCSPPCPQPRAPAAFPSCTVIPSWTWLSTWLGSGTQPLLVPLPGEALSTSPSSHVWGFIPGQCFTGVLFAPVDHDYLFLFENPAANASPGRGLLSSP